MLLTSLDRDASVLGSIKVEVEINVVLLEEEGFTNNKVMGRNGAHCLRMSIFFEHWTVCYDALLSCTG